jgi:hypothetical protein
MAENETPDGLVSTTASDRLPSAHGSTRSRRSRPQRSRTAGTQPYCLLRFLPADHAMSAAVRIPALSGSLLGIPRLSR